MRKESKNGFTLVEIMIALAILVICFIPVSTLLRTSTIQSAFNDYYVLAHIRATRILDVFSSHSYAELIDLNNQAKTGNLVSVGDNEPALPPEYLSRLAPEGYREAYYFVPVQPGLGKLEVVIQWRFPGPNKEWKEYKLEKLVHQRDLSLFTEAPL